MAINPMPLVVKCLEAYLKNPPEDNVVILVIPKLEAAAFKSKWFTACEDNGVTVSCAPLTPVQLKDWLLQRFSKANITFRSRRTGMVM